MAFNILLTLLIIASAATLALWQFFHCKRKVANYILRERKGNLIRVCWAPFGPGWFGEKDAFIYKVQYEDPQGDTHQIFVKSGLFSGVYFTDDKIVESKRK